MFDMGFIEILLIGIVALVVIGPERLPSVARTAGTYLARIRRFVNNVKSDVEQELRTDELQKMLQSQQDELQSLKEIVSSSDVTKEVSSLEKSFNETIKDVKSNNEVISEKKKKSKKVALSKKPDKPAVKQQTS